MDEFIWMVDSNTCQEFKHDKYLFYVRKVNVDQTAANATWEGKIAKMIKTFKSSFESLTK